MVIKHRDRTEASPGVEVARLRSGAGRVRRAVKRYYFAGIGGCGMSGLALMLKQRGYEVAGSDAKESMTAEKLRREGIEVHIGHAGEHLPERLDGVVATAALKEDNPELQEARRRGVKVWKYAEMLGEVSREFRTVAVAGTHGKSTTSGWITTVMKQGERDPSYVIGAYVEQLGSSSGAGQSELLVVEACEYDRSFLNLRPGVGVILNVEADHLDYYHDMGEIVGSFAAFAERVGQDGVLVVNEATRRAYREIGESAGRVETYGGLEADWRAERLRMEQGCGVFELWRGQENWGEVRLGLAGRHNVENALATAAACAAAGMGQEEIVDGLGEYRGVARRMQVRAQAGGVLILDDYAHHPTEIQVTLRAIRERYEGGRLWCIFQPHQHSRTRFLLDEFASSFGDADVVLLPDIYFVRDSEALRREVTSRELAEKIAATGGDSRYCETFGGIVETLVAQAEAGDVIVTMGAGDIWKVADELVCRFA